MINASNEFKQMVNGKGSKKYVTKVNITLSDGTQLTDIGNSDIWQGGIQISEQTSGSGNFDIGFCACNELVLRLKNIDDKYSAYDFYDAEISIFIGLELSTRTEYVPKGIYTVDKPVSHGSYISLTCLDNMHKLDKTIKNISGNTAGQMVQSIASECGVSFTDTTFDGYSTSISTEEELTQYTYRQVLGYICQLTGNYAIINSSGALELRWYDLEAFEQADNLDGGQFDNSIPYSTGDSVDGGDFTFTETESYDGGTFKQTDQYHHIYSLKSADIGTDDVVITGIRVTNDEETYLYGEEGYILEIEGNPFTVGKQEEIATHLGNKIIGMIFRPLRVSSQSNPLVEAGDPAYVSHRGNTYRCYLTSVRFTIMQNVEVACDAQSPQGKRSQGLSVSTRSIIQARKVAKKEISSYDLAMQQLTNLMTNSFGVFKSEEILEDGSIIYYMHDKPTLAESQTIWKMTANTFTVSTNGGQTWNAGIDSSGNAVVNVLNAIGINANWIIAGLLASANNSSWFNLDNDSFSWGNGAITYDPVNGFKLNTTNTKISNGNIDVNGGTITSSTLNGGTINLGGDVNDPRFKATSGIYENNITPMTHRIFKSGSLVFNIETQLSIPVMGLHDPSNSNNKTTITPTNVSCLNLSVSGSKNRVVETKNYGKVLMNAYETPRPSFADTGHGTIANDGLCYVNIDEVFLETIDTAHDYKYFLTKYGQGDLWIREDLNTKEYFVVEGTPDLGFDWKIEAIQRDYNNYNMESPEESIEEDNYIDLANEYLSEYEMEMIL